MPPAAKQPDTGTLLEYHRRPPMRPGAWAAWAMEISGAAVFLVGGTALISILFSDTRFFKMPIGDIISGLIYLCLPLLLGGCACVCGHGLRNGASWAAPACTAILSAILLLLLILMVVIVLNWFGNAGSAALPRFISLSVVSSLLVFYGMVLWSVIRFEMYPRWQSRRVYK